MANLLKNEASAYLRQHADQPVDWYPWGEEARARARREDKPIFLSIGYSTCHWCHVMARESFADDEVAARLRENFIAVKVDREERPDLDMLYMLACQFFTGGGGWPLSVFITPDGIPFFAGTYFPKHGGRMLNVPGFIEILDYLARQWRQDREGLLKNGREVVRLLNSLSAARPVDRPLSVDLLGEAARQLGENFDAEHGGFGSAPKFPSPHQLLFLLRWHRRSGAPIALKMVEKTLARMACGGIFDHLGGGFHRYSVDQAWQIPHFEKMLYDQAMLIMAYSEAQAVAPQPLYAEVVADICSWLSTTMQSPQGLFYTAQDADSEGVEGRYYVWTRAEIDAVLKDEAELFCRHYGVDEKGNFDEIPGASVLRRVTEPGTDKQLETVLAGSREKLLRAREERPAPFVDKKILGAWNGLMIAALARAGKVFKRPEYLETATRAANDLVQRLGADDNRLNRCPANGNQSAIPGFLDDYAFVLQGLLELAASRPESEFLERARALAATVNRLFWDENGEYFFYSGSEAEKLIARNLELHDGALPSSNSTMIINLLRLFSLTGERQWFEQAEKALARGAALAEKTPLLYLHYLSGLDSYLELASS